MPQELTSPNPIASSGTFQLGSLSVNRLGYGAMQISGTGVWGPPKDRDEAIRVLRRAAELGINFIDTADSYGPNVSEELIKEALHPYADEMIIATKAGLTRTGPAEWHPVGRPEYLRQQCEMSLRKLGVGALDLFQLHRIDPKVPAAEQFGLLKALRDEGKVKEVGLSEVSVEDIKAAQEIVPIVSVQNLYNLETRQAEAVLEYCEFAGIGFIPWFPINSGKLARDGGPVDDVAKQTGASPSQVALAWLLARSAVILPIPGTSTVAHVEENCAAALVELTDVQVKELTNAS